MPVSFGLFPAMGFDETQQSLLHICFPISAILAMFFGNQFVDRNFAAEKFLALSHLLGGHCSRLERWPGNHSSRKQHLQTSMFS